jgi:hypothetical protein
LLSFELYGTFRAILEYTAEACILSARSLERGSLPAVDEVDVGLVEDPKPEVEVGAEVEEIIIEDGESRDESSF